MQKKDYKAIAEILRSILNHGVEVNLDRAQFDWIEDTFVLGLRGRYPNFDPAKFRSAVDPNL
jgi:hypothetical protein